MRIAFFYNSRAVIAKYSRIEFLLTLQIAVRDVRWNGNARHAVKNKTVLISRIQLYIIVLFYVLWLFKDDDSHNIALRSHLFFFKVKCCLNALLIIRIFRLYLRSIYYRKS